MAPQIFKPVHASYPSEKLTVGAGVAIFHLATERVVVCYHSRDKYWFLPKGRKNANERLEHAAEREGFEESGYRNRLLPLPMKHRATDPEEGHQAFVTEPLWMQLLPLSSTQQYLLFWFAAETLPRDLERVEDEARRVYRPPEPYPPDLRIQQRVDMDRTPDGQLYQPRRHEGTGVDEEELLYQSYLLTIPDAMSSLRGTVMEDVVRRGWDGVKLRMRTEESSKASSQD